MELAQARQESARLRQELMDALARLQQPRSTHTQTTPRVTAARSQTGQEEELMRRAQAELDAVRAALQAERQLFELQKQQQQQLAGQVAAPMTSATTAAPTTSSATTDAPMTSATINAPNTSTTTAVQTVPLRSRSQSTPSLSVVHEEEETAAAAATDAAFVVGGGERQQQQQHAACRQELDRWREKVRYLERQLETTENALRTHQHLVGENSARTGELNSQLVQLRMRLNEVERRGDEQRLQLDKKEELLRKIIEDKTELFERLDKF
jgi:septal ring factor EnvC (AmiA/AmiB activator)